MYYSAKYDSPVGLLTLISTETALAAILWANDHPDRVKLPGSRPVESEHDILKMTIQQLSEYFGRERKAFDLPLVLHGTDFQQQVWKALLQIPFGQIMSYGQLAKHLGNPDASRAVGAANGKNPISIVVPCHRVVASNGNLTGFAGGVEVKRQLLLHEQSLLF
jgi:methylated-DNA-[protein]-cysteine S-methyltransferase